MSVFIVWGQAEDEPEIAAIFNNEDKAEKFAKYLKSLVGTDEEYYDYVTVEAFQTNKPWNCDFKNWEKR